MRNIIERVNRNQRMGTDIEVLLRGCTVEPVREYYSKYLRIRERGFMTSNSWRRLSIAAPTLLLIALLLSPSHALRQGGAAKVPPIWQS